ncbi:Verru_Chthon cassette protein B [Verrucomicrobium sp. GAS474]|uniref:type IV pilus modification PilV family protein n=1 Tax=Verrucomicrobium sp. GAS474 TaxID=1882831 RepID=UPI00087C23E9|nr:hypothetical protein [Verrucomicrobium sp. GAS474]SDT94863.1 Verru_Chthon cassette protein B [Verrucomicrobium sp. GAS474]
MRPAPSRPSPAFSLIEVLFALGIATLAVVAILALLPAGLQSTRDSLQESEALNILSELIADRKATPLTAASALYALPALTNAMAPVSASFGVRDDHRTTARFEQARWRVSYTFTPPPKGTLQPYLARFRISWPAASTANAESVEGIASFPQP